MEFLTEELNYRTFSGVPCEIFKPIYDNMSKDLMHYVPAASERVAPALIMGNWFGGFYGLVMVEQDLLSSALEVAMEINKLTKAPLLIITTGKDQDAVILDRSYKSKLTKLTEYIRDKGEVGIVSIPKGVLK